MNSTYDIQSEIIDFGFALIKSFVSKDKTPTNATALEWLNIALGIDATEIKASELRSIFTSISLEGKKCSNSNELTYKPQVLGNKEAGMPYAEKVNIISIADIDKDLITTTGKKERVLINAKLAILQKYSSYLAISPKCDDISIYEAIKSACAYCQSMNGDKNVPSFGFVRGEISGIQKFIYDTASKGAAKTLKGRSFYLQVMVDAVVFGYLEKHELTNAAVIYSSGGGFNLMVPVGTEVEDTQKKLLDWMFKNFQASLYLALAISEVSLESIKDGKAGSAWKSIGDQITAQKSRRFADMMVNDYSKFFEPIPYDPERVDKISQLSISGKAYELEGESDPIKPISQITKAQYEIGKLLKSSSKLRLRSGNSGKIEKQFIINEVVGILKETTQDESDNYLDVSFNDFTVYKTDATSWWEGQFYGGADFPKVLKDNKEEHATFEDMAAPDGGEGEFARLGILRMDVDSLGQIFIKGFEEGKYIFARYGQLSRSLDWFFKGYLNTLWEDYKYRIQIIYSGGDDLFIVGRWLEIIEFAELIRNNFREYTCANPAIGLSGGVSIIGGKFPIIKGAAECEGAEKAAKTHTWGQDLKNEKDSITLLGVPLSWKMEYEVVQDIKKTLVTYVGSGHLHRALLQRLITYAEIEADSLRLEGKSALRIRWQMAYDFARLNETKKDISEEIEKLKQFLSSIQKFAFSENSGWGKFESFNSKHSSIKLIGLAARLAELELRTVTKQK